MESEVGCSVINRNLWNAQKGKNISIKILMAIANVPLAIIMLSPCEMMASLPMLFTALLPNHGYGG